MRWDRFIPEIIIPKRIKAWREAREIRRKRKSLGSNGRNTKRLRKRIGTALETKKFFAFLCAVKPLLPLNLLLPLLAVQPLISSFDGTWLAGINAGLKLFVVPMTMAVFVLEIYNFRIRHKWILKRRKSRMARISNRSQFSEVKANAF